MTRNKNTPADELLYTVLFSWGVDAGLEEGLLLAPTRVPPPIHAHRLFDNVVDAKLELSNVDHRLARATATVRILSLIHGLRPATVA